MSNRWYEWGSEAWPEKELNQSERVNRDGTYQGEKRHILSLLCGYPTPFPTRSAVINVEQLQHACMEKSWNRSHRWGSLWIPGCTLRIYTGTPNLNFKDFLDFSSYTRNPDLTTTAVKTLTFFPISYLYVGGCLEMRTRLLSYSRYILSVTTSDIIYSETYSPLTVLPPRHCIHTLFICNSKCVSEGKVLIFTLFGKLPNFWCCTD